MTHSNKSKPKQLHRVSFDALGTAWHIDTPQKLSDVQQNALTQWLADYDKVYSRFRDDSMVVQIATQAGDYVLPFGFADMFAAYQKWYTLTDGAMTPLIGATLEQAGYGKGYSLQPGITSVPPKLEDTVQWSGGDHITMQKPALLDFGAAGKGHAVDGVAALLESYGVSAYVIDASGDIKQRGRNGERIGLELPTNTQKVLGVANVRNKSLCASATNRRAWRGLHHIFDARTARPTDAVLATWVVADSTMIADGMATALFFVEQPEPLQAYQPFEYVRLWANGNVDYSGGFDGELFI